MTTIPEPGCIIDSASGWHAHVAMVEYAISKGYPMTEDDAQSLRTYREDRGDKTSDMIDQGGLMERAEEWLNDNIAEDWHSFGWSSECGGFFYKSDEWWTQG